MVRKKNYYLLVREFWKSPLGRSIKTLGTNAQLIALYTLGCARYDPDCKFYWNIERVRDDLGMNEMVFDNALTELCIGGLLMRDREKSQITVKPFLFKVGKPRRDKPASAWAKKKLIKRDSCCVGCGETRERRLLADHVVSRRNGGRTRLNNLQLLCRHCNTRKAHLVDAKYIAPPGGFA